VTPTKRAAVAAYRARFPERRQAHLAVQQALYHGTLTRQPCATCGRSPTVAHHENYAHPLTVTWLCHQCHRALHSPLAAHGTTLKL